MITRWILSPLESVPSPMVDGAADPIQTAIDYPNYDLPVVRQYCQRFDAPFHGPTAAITFCEMDITQFSAAQKDPRLTIFNTLDDPFPPEAAADYEQLIGTAKITSLRDFLALMETVHVKFAVSE